MTAITGIINDTGGYMALKQSKNVMHACFSKTSECQPKWTAACLCTAQVI